MLRFLRTGANLLARAKRPRRRCSYLGGRPRRARKVLGRRSLVEVLEPRLALDSTVVLNEIMYNPAGSDGGLEWIELYSQMAVDMDLSGWQIADGVRYTFPEGTVLRGGGYLVVAADPATLERTAGVAGALGPWSGKLANSGEKLELRNNTDRLMDEVRYDDEAPWPVVPDGSGASLAKIRQDDAGGSADNWTASAQVGGTPGSRNFLADPSGPRPTDQLIGKGAMVTARVPGPADAGLGTDWTKWDFDDAGWASGPAGVGFDADVPREQSIDVPVVRYYPLNGDGNDASGSGLDAVVSGARFVEDVPFGAGQALDFDGNSDRAIVTDRTDSAVFTFAAWVKPDQIRAQSMVVRSLGSAFPFWTHQIRMTAAGLFEATAIDSTIRVVRGTTVAEAGQWYHVAATVKSNGLLRLFVNGVEEGAAAPVGSLASGGQQWYIGSESGSGNIRYFDGKIDDVAVWHEVVADEKIAALAGGASPATITAGPTFPTPGLLRYYPLEGAAEDRAGDGVDGMVVGATSAAAFPPAVASTESLDFDGLDDQLEIVDPFDPAGYTISAWVQFDTVRKTSIIARAAASGPTTLASHQLRVNASGRFEHQLFDGTRLQVVTGSTVVQPGQWYQVVGTAQSDGQMRLYVNGVQEGAERSIGGLWTGGDRWFLGTDFGRDSLPLDGRIDDLAIWSGPLTAAQIGELYGGRSPTAITGYVGPTGLDVQAAMFQQNASAWVRIEFDVLPGVSYERLRLAMQYDDGFVAYLNGTEVARRNAPPVLAWDAAASRSQADADAIAGELLDISPQADLLRGGRNVLAIHGLNASAADRDFLLGARLEGDVAGPASLAFPVAINEIAAAEEARFWVEIVNTGGQPVDLTGLVLASSAGPTYVLPDQPPLPAGGYLTLDERALGFDLARNEKLYLYAPEKAAVLDGVRIGMRLRGRDGTGRWQTPSGPTPGAANSFSVSTDIVINEILYHDRPTIATGADRTAGSTGFAVSDEEWIELYNRSAVDTVDLGGWRLADAVEFVFPPGTTIGPDQYLVVARDPASVELQFAEVFAAGDVLGPYAKTLSNSDERIALVDASGNLVDQVHYYDGGRWPAFADGGGSSLELRDPRADNSVAEAWAASDEAGVLERSEWRQYSYEATVEPQTFDPTVVFQELVLGLLDAGEVLLDNVSVVEDPGGANIERMQNGDFELGPVGEAADKWRIQGTHGRSHVVLDPKDPANQVLRLIADRPMANLSNHAETTLADDARITVGTTYRISFDALWVTGSPQLHTELPYRDAARTTILEQPERSGTPGARNSTAVANLGPTYADFGHNPVVPGPGDEVTVAVTATDPDGVAALTLMVRVDGAGPFTALPMTPGPAGTYTATLAGQPDRTVVQFYVEGQDGLGAVSTFPAAGPDSRALYKVVDGFARDPVRHDLQLIMTPADIRQQNAATAKMDNQFLGATVIYDGVEVFYDAGVRLKGSMFSRGGSDTGYKVQFPSDQRFRGVHKTVALDQKFEKEILIKHLINQVGVPGGMYDDVVRLRSPSGVGGGPTLLSMARHTSVYLDSQFQNGSDGAVFKLQGVEVPTITEDGTPEGPKLFLPFGGARFDIQDMGDDKELYRWPLPIKNSRDRDDYSRIIDLAKAFSLDGAQLQQAVAEVIDVDEWMQVFAMMSLGGIGDTYSQDWAHNLAFYVRPEDNKVLAFPWDWDFTFTRPPGAPLHGDANIAKVIELPVYNRLFLGHLWNMIGTVFNPGYMAYWTESYGAVLGSDYSTYVGAIRNRTEFVLSQLPAAIPFEITSAGGGDVAVAASVALVEGRGWIDVNEIRQAGSAEPLAVTWLDGENWQVSVAVASGPNDVRLEAYDRQGALVGADSVTVTAFTLLGDMNGDGLVNASDTSALVLALRNPLQYEARYGVRPDRVGDADGDGDVDFDDIDDFRALVTTPVRAAARAPQDAEAAGPRPGATESRAARRRLKRARVRFQPPEVRLQDAVWSAERDWLV